MENREPKDDGAIGLAGPVLAGLIILTLFVGALGAWSVLAPLDSAAVAPGIVTVETRRKTIQHLEGGIVGEILVREGETVTGGQVLVRLDGTQARATQDMLQARWIKATVREARLVAERDGLETLAASQVPTMLREDPRAAEALQVERNLFAARRDAIAREIGIQEQRVLQLEQEIKGLKGEIWTQGKRLKLIGQETEQLRPLVEKGLARRPRLLQLEQQTAELEGERALNRARIGSSREAIKETRLRIAELGTRRATEAAESLDEVQGVLFDLAERMRAAGDVLARTEILAPMDGTVVALQIHTPGGVIAPGAPIMDIVPRDEGLVIEAQLDPGDIDIVAVGLPVEIRFTALNQRHSVPATGRVTSVSADLLSDESSQRSFYLVRVVLDGNDYALPHGVALQPGMYAEVFIKTGQQTVLDYLAEPILNSFNRAFREG